MSDGTLSARAPLANRFGDSQKSSQPRMSLTPRSGARPAWFTPRDANNALRSIGKELVSRNFGAPANYCRTDPAPGVPPAGKPGEVLLGGGIQARRGLQPGLIVPAPKSPDSMTATQRRHRQKGEPGEMSTHWGLKNSKIPDAGEGYGKKTNKDEDVAQNFKSGQLFGVAEYINARGEDVYHSTKREPLAKAFQRGHVFPDEVHDPDFKGFGRPLDSTMPAKEVMFPRDRQPDTQEVKELYKRTHGSTDPGEGLDRKYDWPEHVKGNPIFRFGHANQTVAPGSGAKSALSMDCGVEPLSVPATLIVKDTLANFQEITSDHIGTSRNLMQLQSHQNLGRHHSFGKPTSTDPVSAGSLIHGNYSHAEQMPDADLGKCLLKGRRNFETEPRGVPSVRFDKVAPPLEKRSVANDTNYGDDLHAGSLITPTRFQFLGIFAEDFVQKRPVAEVASLLRGAGFCEEDEKLDAIVQRAGSEDGNGKASLEDALGAIEEWLSTETN